MTQKALRVLDDAIAAHSPSHVFALFSGGHDSLCSTALAADHPAFTAAIHINTGIGIEETREFVHDTCKRHGWPVHEVCAWRDMYERLVMERGGFPYGPKAHNSMLWYLKQKPLQEFLRLWHKGKTVAFVTGIRKDESVRRMGSGISVPIRKDGKKVWVSPILDWNKGDCNRFIEKRGLERNRVVDLLHRSGECLCGALADEREIHDIDLWFPEVGQRIHALEKRVEDAGIPACIWAGRGARKLDKGQMQLFSKAAMPLCASCEVRTP